VRAAQVNSLVAVPVTERVGLVVGELAVVGLVGVPGVTEGALVVGAAAVGGGFVGAGAVISRVNFMPGFPLFTSQWVVTTPLFDVDLVAMFTR
jgi:hypothetical protein